MKKHFCAALCGGLFFAMLAGSAVAKTGADHTPPRPFNEKVRVAQMRLADLGYFVGYFDGAMGPKTKRAIISFQRIHGLRANGQLTEKTCKALFSTDYMAHHYYLSGYYSRDGYVGNHNSYPYNQPGSLNPQTSAWMGKAEGRPHNSVAYAPSRQARYSDY